MGWRRLLQRQAVQRLGERERTAIFGETLRGRSPRARSLLGHDGHAVVSRSPPRDDCARACD